MNAFGLGHHPLNFLVPPCRSKTRSDKGGATVDSSRETVGQPAKLLLFRPSSSLTGVTSGFHSSSERADLNQIEISRNLSAKALVTSTDDLRKRSR